MKYPIIFREIEELGLDKIYDLTGNRNQYGGKDLDSESESKILEELTYRHSSVIEVNCSGRQ